MKFICDKSELQNACSMIGRAVPSRSPITALEGFLIETGADKITITGYDLKKAIYTSVSADVPENGTMVINARMFSEMVRKMPDGMVTVECSKDNKVTVKCGKVHYQLPGLDAESYPELPALSGVNSIEIPQKELKSMINQTLYAVSKDEVRPIYTGSLFEIEGNTLTIVSVDGYRLAKRVEEIENAHLENCKFVVPGFALNDIEKFCSDEGSVKVEVGEKHISFDINNTVVITRRLEGDFLNYRKSIPTEFKHEIEVSRGELMSVIDRVALFLSEKNGNPVKMTFGDNEIKCLCNTVIGTAEDVCYCSGTGEDLEIGFNDRYFTEALKAADVDRIKICLNTASSPCIVKSAEGEEKFTFMILPVRLHAGR